MEKLSKRNGKSIWIRVIKKTLKRFDASVEWLIERVNMRDEEMAKIRRNENIQEQEKEQMLRKNIFKSIADALEEVDVLVVTHYFNEFSETKSSTFLKKVIENRNVIDTRLFKKTRRSLNCSPKTMKVTREILENLCIGKRRELITKKRTESTCRCSQYGMKLNARHIVSCCRKVNAEINTRHDTVVNVLMNYIQDEGD